MNRKELNAQDKMVEQTMMEKGLGYTARRGFEAHQVFAAARDAGSQYNSSVIARIRTESGHDYFAYGFYGRDEAEAVARKVKRTRKFYIQDVIIVDASRSV